MKDDEKKPEETKPEPETETEKPNDASTWGTEYGKAPELIDRDEIYVH